MKSKEAMHQRIKIERLTEIKPPRLTKFETLLNEIVTAPIEDLNEMQKSLNKLGLKAAELGAVIADIEDECLDAIEKNYLMIAAGHVLKAEFNYQQGLRFRQQERFDMAKDAFDNALTELDIAIKAFKNATPVPAVPYDVSQLRKNIVELQNEVAKKVKIVERPPVLMPDE